MQAFRCRAGDKIFSPHNNSGILDAGDIESMPFIEALDHFSYRAGKEIVNSHNFLFSLHILKHKDVASVFIFYIDRLRLSVCLRIIAH